MGTKETCVNDISQRTQSTDTEYHTQPCVDVGSCEHSNQMSGSLKDGNSLTRLANVHFSDMTLLHGINHCYMYSDQYLPMCLL
jgi:hypothetical protein